MPSKQWTPEHRAAYEATMAAKAEARAAGREWVKPKRTYRAKANDQPVERFDTSALEAQLAQLLMAQPDANRIFDLLEDLRRLVSLRDLDDMVERIRQTSVRIEDSVALAREARPQTDERLVAAVQSINRRLAALEAAVSAPRAHDAAVLKTLRRLESRPAHIIEYRPLHRREAEGGEPVRTQRQRVGLPKRSSMAGASTSRSGHLNHREPAESPHTAGPVGGTAAARANAGGGRQVGSAQAGTTKRPRTGRSPAGEPSGPAD